MSYKHRASQRCTNEAGLWEGPRENKQEANETGVWGDCRNLVRSNWCEEGSRCRDSRDKMINRSKDGT